MPDFASIYTLANRPTTQLADPLDVAKRGQAYQENRMKLQDLAQARADDQAIRDAFAKAAGPGGEIDRGMVLKDLAGRAPMAGQKLQQQWTLQDAEGMKQQASLYKSLTERSKAELDAAAKLTDMIGRNAYAAQSPEQWDANFTSLAKIIPSASEHIGKFSPEYRANLINQAKTMAQMIEEQQTQKPQSAIGRINEDERRGLITPQQAEMARRRATTQAPTVQVGFSQPFEVMDPKTQKPILVQQDKAGNLRPVEEYVPKTAGKFREIPSSVITNFVENEGLTDTIETAIQGLRKKPDAIGGKTMIPDIALQRIDPEGAEVRALIAQVGSLKYKDMSGAAVTVSEDKRMAPYIPKLTDSAETARVKLKGLLREIGNIQKGISDAYREGFRQIPQFEKYQGGGKGKGKGKALPKEAAPIPRITGPNDPALQRLKPGDRFIGHDGIERVKR